MNKKYLLNLINNLTDFQHILDSIKQEKSLSINGLRTSSFSYFTSALNQALTVGTRFPHPHENAGQTTKVHPSFFLVIEPNQDKAEETYENLKFFGINALLFPKWEILPYEENESLKEISLRRLETFFQLVNFSSITNQDYTAKTPVGATSYYPVIKGEETSPPQNNNQITLNKSAIIVLPVDTLLQRVIPPDYFPENILRFRYKDKINVEALSNKLIEIGYQRSNMVEIRGEYSIRGGIIDIFTLNYENPIRIDLFGDEIESIRLFNPYTHRSIKKIDEKDEVVILPANETSILNKLIENGINLPSFFSYFPNNTIIIQNEPGDFQNLLEEYQELIKRLYNEAVEEGRVVYKPDLLYINCEELMRTINEFQQINCTILDIEKENNYKFSLNISTFINIEPSFSKYVDIIKTNQKNGYTIEIVCDNKGQALRLEELLKEFDIGAVNLAVNPDMCRDATFCVSADEHTPSPFPLPSGERIKVRGLDTDEIKEIIISEGELHDGFLFPDIKLMLITDREIFGRYRRKLHKIKYKSGRVLRGIDEIKAGDYIVHTEYGIGRYEGITRTTIDNNQVDLISITYQGGDKLYVPVDKIKYVQKYIAVEGVEPILDRLGGTRWAKVKAKQKAEIEKIASELLQLYAERETVEGFRFGDDTLWQREFEASFLYEETPDQLEAIEDVKKDMTSIKPMDRLICGDVGYGKTEVAIRAAFKAIQDNKQVAVLVPTTILAYQHFTTFSERFADFPVKVEMLSRFKTPKEQREIIKRLKEGKVDVVIGTHRLLSLDIQFKDLGLIVIDEEQRFGVKQKEKLKQLKKSVDVITLSATPIPRTLYMALSGLRDMSIINTPPENRLPIKTMLIHFDRELITEAILRELNRGGQVYFVHNRVYNIDKVAEQLHSIVPKAKIAIAHGQIDEKNLEQVMIDFINQKYDILLSTTIIENGLDIPNVNTIIINRADALGLAELYQLRGRVGRDIHRAYAYLIVPKGTAITDTARERLNAIREFTELGSGFGVAMKDMEIRGTGNILGKEQHGSIVSIGFELYCQMLEEAVKRLKGETIKESIDVEIKWDNTGYISEKYIPVESHRFMFYKKLSKAESEGEIQEIKDELNDIYGEYPPEIEQLINLAHLRVLCEICGIKSLQLLKTGLKFVFEDRIIHSEHFPELINSIRKMTEVAKVVLTGEGELKLKIDWEKYKDTEKAFQDNKISVALTIIQKVVRDLSRNKFLM